jgi:hypothetical protein
MEGRLRRSFTDDYKRQACDRFAPSEANLPQCGFGAHRTLLPPAARITLDLEVATSDEAREILDRHAFVK